jgi:uroporphyrinogen III methyltransferase / synthase
VIIAASPGGRWVGVRCFLCPCRGDLPVSKVYIVGAGPGDPGLITAKGLAALSAADCVVYDRLASPDLLNAAPPSAERIYVGKRPGAHSMPQSEINTLLVERARRGRVIVRLKGGDPLLFGRGSEEADALAAAGIDFEIIPGVTAALGAAAYAGIPLTDRRDSSLVTFVTGQEGEGGSPGVDWRALAAARGTIVLYMGRSELGAIVCELAAAGLPVDTSAAIVENATLPSQRVVAATLSTIAAAADAARLEPPCITIIGAVAARYPSLSWFERLPLFGKTVCLTRPEGAQDALAARLCALGARVIRFPAIEIVPASPETLALGLAELPDADWVVFTSAVGVETFFTTLICAGRDSRALAGKRLAAVGPATAEALAAAGISADLVPRTFTGLALLDELLAASQDDEEFLLWRAAGAREELGEGLKNAGRLVVEVSAYEAVRPRDVDAALRDSLVSDPPSAVLFASASSARSFVELLGAESACAISRVSRFVSIGPVTSAALRELGLTVHAESAVHTSDGLLDAVVDVLAGKRA